MPVALVGWPRFTKRRCRMSIPGISSSTNPYQDPASRIQSVRQDFSGLTTSLASGDLTAAQNAFATLMQDLKAGGLHHHHHHRHTGSAQSTNLSTDLTAIGNALQSNDLAGAQKAFATLMQDIGNNGTQSTTAAGNTGTQSATNGQSNATSSLLDALQTTNGISQNGSASSASTLIQALSRYAQVGLNLSLPATGLLSLTG
jgi:hypothetical protein